MECQKCGNTYIEKRGGLQITDKFVGQFAVELDEYFICSGCGGLLFSLRASRQIEKARENLLQELLQLRSIKAFVTLKVAAEIIGISRQALHKHRRIRHGFIYQTKFAGITVYLKQSVLRFKSNGDGRFPLQSHIYIHPSKYVKHSSITSTPAYSELKTKLIKHMNLFLQDKFINQEEYSYVK